REQADAAGLTRLVLPLERLEEPGEWERLCLEAVAHAPRALLITTDTASSDSRRVERRLAAAAVVVVDSGVSGLVLTGGATARAVLDALGARAVDVRGELRPGVPQARIEGGSAHGM